MRENNEVNTPLSIIETDSNIRDAVWLEEHSDRYIIEAHESGIHLSIKFTKMQTAHFMQEQGIKAYLEKGQTEDAARLLDKHTALEAELNAEFSVA